MRAPSGSPAAPDERRTKVQDRTARRGKAYGFGLDAEWVAAALLRLKGYSILARRYVVSGGEIDLIVRRGETIAFVEVKARSRLEAAEDLITAAKRRRITRAARAWLARNPWTASMTLRGDAVLVAVGRLPRHTPCAYRLELD
jgi:putative endonuclease